MKTLSCRTSRRFLAQRNAGLDDAERLHLEFHLSTCEACAEHSRALSAMTKLVDSDAIKPLSPRARERAIAASLRVLDQPMVIEPNLEPAPRFRITWQLGAAAVAAAGITAFVMLSNSSQVYKVSEAPRPGIGLSRADHTNRTPSAGVRVVSGTVALARGSASAGDIIDDSTRLSSRSGAELRFGDVHVVMAGNTTIGWKTNKRTIAVARGRVRVASKADAGVLRVVTRSFAVIVAGSEASVSNGSVRVHRGTVEVVSPSGKVLAKRVHKFWTPLRIAGAKRHHARRPRHNANEADRPDPATLLRDARAAVARRDLQAAREHIHAAQAQSLTGAQRAEALTLLADAAFVGGDDARAVELYLGVARKYRSLAAGQNALYAAARLQAKRGERAAARKLFHRYLARYPDGRFRAEATRRLARLNP